MIKPFTDPEITVTRKARDENFDLEPQEVAWLKDQVKDKVDAEEDNELLVALATDLGVV